MGKRAPQSRQADAEARRRCNGKHLRGGHGAVRRRGFFIFRPWRTAGHLPSRPAQILPGTGNDNSKVGAEPMTTNHDIATLHNADPDAAKIADLYAQSRGSMVEAMRFAVACGLSLTMKKQNIAHGQWLPWLSQCGCAGLQGPTANLLIKAASDPQLTSDLMRNVDDATALAIVERFGATPRRSRKREVRADRRRVQLGHQNRPQGPRATGQQAAEGQSTKARPRAAASDQATAKDGGHPPLVDSDDDGYEEWECCDLCGCDPPNLPSVNSAMS